MDSLTRPITLEEIKAVEEMWEFVHKGPLCDHEGAVSVDENGVFFFNCKKCGRYGFTTQEAARTLGWIE